MKTSMKSRLCVATTALALVFGMGGTAWASDEDQAATLKALQAQINALQKQVTKLQAAQSKAAKEQASVASSAVTVDDKGAFKLPGTGTTIKVGGYVKADVLHDFSSRPTLSSSVDSTASDFTNYMSIPTSNDQYAMGRRKNSTRFDARQSRINLATSTPTSYGAVGTLIEVDFYGTGGTAVATNSYGLRLRRAFGTFNGFLIGQEWTSFGDNAAGAELLDVNGPAGQTSMRQAQIRYTHDLKDGHTLVVAVENPETDINATTNDVTGAQTATASAINHYPDVVLGWKYQAGWGHVGARAVGRNLAIKSKDGAYDENKWGYGVALSGKWLPFQAEKEAYAKDSLSFLIQGGRGIGRYMSESLSLGAATDTGDADRNLHLLTSWGGNVGYRHFWTGDLRSTVLYGFSRTEQKAFFDKYTQKRAESVHANLIWSPVSSVDLGVEYIWGHRVVHNGAEGFINRLQASAAYRF